MKKVIIVSMIFLSTFQLFSQTLILDDTSTLILGTWVSEEDSNFTVEFTANGNCIWNYPNESAETQNYLITTDSSDCDSSDRRNLNRTNKIYYLILIDTEDNSETCFEILGVNSQTLSYSTIGLGVKNYFFNKQ